MASRLTSCLPTPIWTRRCRARAWRCSPAPARYAVPARGCSSSAKSTTSSSAASPSSSKTLRVGDGRDPDTRVGPLVSEEQLKRVTGYLAIGRQEGARPLSGGERLTDGALAKGDFVPTDGVRQYA